MSYGPKQVFTTTIASGLASSAVLDLGDKSYKNWAINPSLMGDVITVYGSTSATGNFLAVNERVNTAPVQYQSLTVATNVSGMWGVIDAPPFRYVKFICASTITNGSTINVMVQD
jgi:hypothetical protein